MADSAKYVTTMYELFWNGNTPVETKDAKGEPGKSVMVPQKAKADLDALFAQAKKLRGETEAS
jgi:hypothetical protein